MLRVCSNLGLVCSIRLLPNISLISLAIVACTVNAPKVLRAGRDAVDG